LSDDGDGDAVFDGVACLEGIGQSPDGSFGVVGQFAEVCAVGKGDVFVGEI